MRNTVRSGRGWIVVLAGVLAACAARAASLTWDVTDSNDQTINDGSGTWNTADELWNDATLDNANVAWNNTANANDTAVIGAGGAGGTITLGGAISLAGLTFNTVSTAYTLTGGSLNKVGGVLTITAAADTAIASAISGTTGLTKAGTGRLTLSGNSSYTGNTTLSAGTLLVTSASGLGQSGLVSLVGGTTLQLHIDGGGTIALPCALGWGSNNSATIDVNNDTTGTGGVIQLNGTALTGTASATLTVTGGNGYSLYVAKINSTAGNATTLGAITFNPTTAALTIGTIQGGKHNNTVTDTYTLGGTAAGNAVTGLIANSTVGAPTLIVKSNSSTWTLSNTANTYSGATTITGGALEALALANGGANSSIGASSSAATSLVFGDPAATLRYMGSADVTTDRGFTTSSGAGGGATIESSGTGTLSFDNTVAIAYGTANQTRTITLTGSNTGANTFPKLIADNGTGLTSLTKTGTGTWVLNGANTYTGPTTLSGGTLVVGNVSALSASLSASSGTTLRLATDSSVDTFSVGGSTTFVSDRATEGAGIIHALGHFTPGGNTSSTFEKGANVTSGTAAVSFASLGLGGSSSSTYTLNPTTAAVTITGTATTTGGTGTRTLALGGTIAGNAINDVISNGTRGISLTKSGTSTWTLGGANTYTGATAIDGGILRITHANALGATAGNTTIGTGVGSIATLELSGGISVGEDLVVRGYNTAADADRIVNVSGNNTLSANLSVNTGGVCYGFRSDAGRLLIAGNITRGNATGTRTIYLRGDGDGEIAGTINGGGGSPVYTPSLVKEGAGTWTLSGASSNGGTTTVKAGTLSLGAAGSLPSASSVEVYAGAVLDVTAPAGGLSLAGADTWLRGGGTIAGNLSVDGQARLSPGESSGVTSGTLNVGGDLTLGSDAVLAYEIGTLSDKIAVTGNLHLGAAAIGMSNFIFVPVAGFSVSQTYVLIEAAGVTGALDPADATGTIDGVPCSLAVANGQLVLRTLSGQGTLIVVR